MNHRDGQSARSAKTACIALREPFTAVPSLASFARFAYGAAAFALILALSGCSGKGEFDLSKFANATVLRAEISPFPAKQARKVRVGVMPDAGALPLYLMDGVELIPFQSARERDAALTVGELDAIMGDMVTVIAHQQKGIELRALTVTESRFLLVAGPKFRESARHNVGISENTVIEYVTDTLASDMNLDKISVPQVPVRLEMLRHGQIPLACLTDVMAWGLLANGFRIVRDTAGSGLEPAVLVVTGDFARKHPADLKAFAENWNRAVEKINENPESFSNLLLEQIRLPSSDYPVPHYRPVTLPTEEQVQSVIDWFTAKYGLSRSVSYANLVIQ